MVERLPEEQGVGSSILPLDTSFGPIAQWESEELITLRSGVQFTLGLPSLGVTHQGDATDCKSVAVTQRWVRFPSLPP